MKNQGINRILTFVFCFNPFLQKSQDQTIVICIVCRCVYSHGMYFEQKTNRIQSRLILGNEYLKTGLFVQSQLFLKSFNGKDVFFFTRNFFQMMVQFVIYYFMSLDFCHFSPYFRHIGKRDTSCLL